MHLPIDIQRKIDEAIKPHISLLNPPIEVNGGNRPGQLYTFKDTDFFFQVTIDTGKTFNVYKRPRGTNYHKDATRNLKYQSHELVEACSKWIQDCLEHINYTSPFDEQSLYETFDAEIEEEIYSHASPEWKKEVEEKPLPYKDQVLLLEYCEVIKKSLIEDEHLDPSEKKKIIDKIDEVISESGKKAGKDVIKSFANIWSRVQVHAPSLIVWLGNRGIEAGFSLAAQHALQQYLSQ